jgi:hypothetical protein
VFVGGYSEERQIRLGTSAEMIERAKQVKQQRGAVKCGVCGAVEV